MGQETHRENIEVGSGAISPRAKHRWSECITHLGVKNECSYSFIPIYAFMAGKGRTLF
jgi:hypothetical protein